ncbi:MAG: Ser/Thr protein kinase [Gammaproteobacteria bacterium CG11_big_fil_rev_8_21_14_0_20_46_22]|nr:MAG: Ser/Thr protein kinase [Gammaproteobacteria bacterium CG12_big_fil_rev_8_21_14_0_65_46_12]PIR11815.1 MAG: Ser/Thr protein kinase [Gammaproteobacteria bacterium CG11_big_fil_rev_8_21_14_0_20_46_22]
MRCIKPLGIFFGFMLLANLGFAAPSKQLWPRWQANTPHSTKIINHASFQHFLNHYVYTTKTGVNFVRYAKVTAQDKTQLKTYLKQLSQIPIAQYNRSVQLAYWINLYNALTIETVLQHYPVKSIRDIKLGSWFSSAPWDAKLITVEGVPVSLNDIEHRIIRPIWNDPRTHYALNCASYSCPNLQKQVYTGKTVNTMLTQDAKEYINSPRAVSIKNNKLIVSSIYDWYQIDFGGNEQAVIQHLKKYARPALRQQLNHFRSISAYHYDWRLNGN